MEMLPPAPSVVVGAAVEKRFPGYGTYRGTIEEINGGKVVVHWAATDERTSLSRRRRADGVVAVLGRDLASERQEVAGVLL